MAYECSSQNAYDDYGVSFEQTQFAMDIHLNNTP